MNLHLGFVCCFLSASFVSGIDTTNNLFPIVQLITNLLNEVAQGPIDLNLVCDLSFVSLGINKRCAEQLTQICRNKSVALRFLDASSKFPYSGMLTSNRFHLGHYDECVNTELVYEDGRIVGKHCLAGLIIPDITNISDLNLAFKLSTCLPDKCSSKDIIKIASTFVKDFPPIIRDEFCTTKDTGSELTSMNIVVIMGFIFWIFLMILSTIYDVYLYLGAKKCETPVLIAFSIFTNGKKLFSTTVATKDQLEVLNGLRVISMIWIIAGHAILLWLQDTETNSIAVFPIMNKDYLTASRKHRSSSYLDGAHMAVDTFFFMSGFLLAFIYFKEKRSLSQQLKSVPFLYIHRILRLAPSIIALYVLGMWVFPLVGSGPIWNLVIDKVLAPCKKYWWSYFLFVQNYVNWDELCLIHTWYLSADMQMFLISPLFLIPLSVLLSKKRGFCAVMVILLLLNAFWIVMPIVVRLQLTEFKNAFDTHSRLIDYFLGMMLGIFFRERMHVPFLCFVRTKYRSVLNLIIWVFVLTEMFISMFYYQDAEVYQGPTAKAYYYVLSRSSWCVGLCWIVYSCYHGYGGIINWILTRSIYQIMSRLTYSMYLLHLPVMGWYAFQNREMRNFSHYEEYYMFCGHYITTLVLSVLWTLAFESPIIAIEKVIFARKPSATKNDSKEDR